MMRAAPKASEPLLLLFPSTPKGADMRVLARLTRLAVSILVFRALPATVSAQATIAGVVKDTSGAVLPGVTVEAASPALIEKVRTAVSDAKVSSQLVVLDRSAPTERRRDVLQDALYDVRVVIHS